MQNLRREAVGSGQHKLRRHQRAGAGSLHWVSLEWEFKKPTAWWRLSMQAFLKRTTKSKMNEIVWYLQRCERTPPMDTSSCCCCGRGGRTARGGHTSLSLHLHLHRGNNKTEWDEAALAKAPTSATTHQESDPRLPLNVRSSSAWNNAGHQFRRWSPPGFHRWEFHRQRCKYLSSIESNH